MSELSPLKLFRLRRGVTQKQLADLLGVTETSVQRWETGRWKIPHGRKVDLARILGAPPERIFPESFAVSKGGNNGTFVSR